MTSHLEVWKPRGLEVVVLGGERVSLGHASGHVSSWHTTGKPRRGCRPLFRGEVYAEAASVKRIAESLWVTPAAVQQHLLNLYDTFEIREGRGRRGQLAAEALRRRVVTAADFGGPT